ncbi:MAG: hypothetical protein GKR89_11100 [Candidatus Latescibacteria bacterium]|nr:hypothetical protein [Candidatus Latescibacterota bacterium]
MFSKRPILLLLCLPLVLAVPLGASETITVGEGVGGRGWDRIRETAQFVAVDRDSIWMWEVAPDANLAAGMPQRQGRVGCVRIPFIGDPVLIALRNGEAIYDGRDDTAVDPDQFPQLERTTPLVFDLGFAFRINRIRFFPRLDRQNQRRFLQQFSMATSADNFTDFEPLFDFPSHRANTEPVLERRFPSRTARYIRLSPTTERPWEIAELEVYGDGTVPVGEYVSVPISTRRDDIVWGKVGFEGGPISRATAVVQTRTGFDDQPQLYFYRPVAGVDEFEVIEKKYYYATLEEEQRGPIKPNPAWSGWETVADDLIRSPGLRRYLQFRVLFTVPGTQLRQLSFEYIRPPVARELAAEIHPAIVTPGAETRFTLSMQIHLKTTSSNSFDPRDSGFTHIRVQTDAEIGAVEKVLVDDREIFFAVSRQPGQGFTVNLFRRIEQNGSFIQLKFAGRVFRDRTRFEVGALDRRPTDEGVDEAYQVARAADIDRDFPGGGLEVRLDGDGDRLVTDMHPAAPLFTPNGDGVNDTFILNYNLLKLVAPALVALDIYDLTGRLVRRAYEGRAGNGRYLHTWDGLDDRGRPVPPGLYLYEVRVEADVDTRRRLGAVGVAY